MLAAGASFGAQTTELFDLFATRFFRADPGVVGRIVEPGHHHEWVWLLRRFEQASGRSVQAYVDALYGHADRYGFDEAGMIVGELLVDGTPRTGVRRIWPVAEAIKANLVEARRGRTQGEGRAAALAVLLRDRFLTLDPPGGSLDKLGHNGRCVNDFMPASTLYHLLGVIDELSRFAGRSAWSRPVYAPGRAPR
jgi:mannose/cellobiose epimerase-like protein (N-acyl-D-glucosamine 2-epimerase family)